MLNSVSQTVRSILNVTMELYNKTELQTYESHLGILGISSLDLNYLNSRESIRFLDLFFAGLLFC